MTFLEVAQGAWHVIITIAQFLSPFLLLWVGYVHTRKEKKEEKAEKAVEKAEDARYDKLLTAINTVTQSLQESNAEIVALRDDLDQYRTDTETLSKDIAHIAALNRLNGRYTHELAQLVVVIGEGVRDQHLDGNITKAISTYRKFESNVLGSFVADESPT